MAQEPIERPGGPYANEIATALLRHPEATSRFGLPVAELGRRTGLDRPLLSQIVNGHRLPSAEQLDAICAALGWTPEQLYPVAAFREAIEATRRADVEDPA